MGSGDRAELAKLRQENAALKKEVAQSEAAERILQSALDRMKELQGSTDTGPESESHPK